MDVQRFPPPSMMPPLPQAFLRDVDISNANVLHISQSLYFQNDSIPIPDQNNFIDVDLVQRIVQVVPKSIGVFVTTVTECWVRPAINRTAHGSGNLLCTATSVSLILGVLKEAVTPFRDDKFHVDGTERTSKRQRRLNNAAPDKVLEVSTSPNQALLYRLGSGDYNKIHVAGSSLLPDGPILHGLCTLGIATNACLRYLEGTGADYTQVRAKCIRAKFTAPVQVGSSLTISIWVNDQFQYVRKKKSVKGLCVLEFRVRCEEKVVVDGGCIEIEAVYMTQDSSMTSKL